MKSVGGNGRPAEVLFSDGTWLEAAAGVMTIMMLLARHCRAYFSVKSVGPALWDVFIRLQRYLNCQSLPSCVTAVSHK